MDEIVGTGRFVEAPGLGAALTGMNDNRAYYLLDGDLNQMGIMEMRLRSAGFRVVKSNVYPGFAENDKEEYLRALKYIYDHRLEGWWGQIEAMDRHGVCPEEESRAALRKEVEADESE